MAEVPQKVVFDCPVFAQALINPKGPAAACIEHARGGRLTLFTSDYVLQEIRELPGKINPRFGVTPERVEWLIRELAKFARPVESVPPLYTHPIDPDDSHYVNLALASGAMLIVSRDRHLLNLMDQQKNEAKAFKTRFPTLVVTTPDILAAELRTGQEKL